MSTSPIKDISFSNIGNQLKRTIVVTVFWALFASPPAAAGQSESDSTIAPSANNIVYLDLATGFIQTSFSLNYERTWESLGLRFRCGRGISFEVGSGYGGMLMINYYPVTEHGFELGAGLSVIREDPEGQSGTRTNVYPAASLCFRIQPANGGLFFRVGVANVYYYGAPIAISLGFVF